MALLSQRCPPNTEANGCFVIWVSMIFIHISFFTRKTIVSEFLNTKCDKFVHAAAAGAYVESAQRNEMASCMCLSLSLVVAIFIYKHDR
jgi:hypothetical protein